MAGIGKELGESPSITTEVEDSLGGGSNGLESGSDPKAECRLCLRTRAMIQVGVTVPVKVLNR